MGRTAATVKRVLDHRKAALEEEARPSESHRETVEAIVVALILALVVRGFEAQAFVIPTGSMAPTLMGRHKELQLPAMRLRLFRECVARGRGPLHFPARFSRESASIAASRPAD